MKTEIQTQTLPRAYVPNVAGLRAYARKVRVAIDGGHERCVYELTRDAVRLARPVLDWRDGLGMQTSRARCGRCAECSRSNGPHYHGRCEH